MARSTRQATETQTPLRDPFDNNTGQANQVRVTNQAHGLSLTAEYAFSDNLSTKLIVSDRKSEYESGLDDDGFIDDFLSFPELGKADQTSIELQLNGEFGNWDFVSGLYSFTEEGSNFQDPTIFLGGRGDFLLSQDLDSFAVFCQCRLCLVRRSATFRRRTPHPGRQDGED